MSTYFKVSFRDKFIGNLGDNAAHDPGIEEGDVGDPEHAENEWAHKDGKITTPGGGCAIPTRNIWNKSWYVTKIDFWKLVL